MCVPKYSVVLSLDIHPSIHPSIHPFAMKTLWPMSSIFFLWLLGVAKQASTVTQVAGAHSDGGDGDGICSKTFVFRSPGVSFRAGVSRSSPCAAGYVPHETRASCNMSTWW